MGQESGSHMLQQYIPFIDLWICNTLPKHVTIILLMINSLQTLVLLINVLKIYYVGKSSLKYF